MKLGSLGIAMAVFSFDLGFTLFRKASEKLKDGRAQLLFLCGPLSSVIKPMSMKILGLE